MSENPKSKVAAVTGGASGIGREIVAALAARGYLVVVLDIAEPAAPGLDAARAHVATDVGDEAQVEAAFDTVEGRFGRLDALVNCAGVDIATPLIDTLADEWERVQRVNATGVFLCTAGRRPPAGGARLRMHRLGLVRQRPPRVAQPHRVLRQQGRHRGVQPSGGGGASGPSESG